MDHSLKNIITNPWSDARRYTPARIALGHASGSLPTTALLAFQMDHASARDAVHSAAEFDRIECELQHELRTDCIHVHSAATDRHTFLKRPDLGRRLDNTSRNRLATHRPRTQIALILADGLSATAINLHGAILAREIVDRLRNKSYTHQILLAHQSRVALGDEIGELLGSAIAVMLIGERPGLSNAESIGAYITYMPRIGRTDAERNCISNICPIGLSIKCAALEIIQLIDVALEQKATGIQLGIHLQKNRLAGDINPLLQHTPEQVRLTPRAD